MRPFSDRHEAGRALAARLDVFTRVPDAIVLALPRGGVPVAFEVARALGIPLDVFVVRKLGAPVNEEYAIGAIASGGVAWVDEERIRQLGITGSQLDDLIAREAAEVVRREKAYRDDQPPPELAERTVILVDDGLATGSTMLAAVRAVREFHPGRIIVAVPVASVDACDLLRREGVEFRCVATPDPFFAVGAWYADFSQTTDEEVRYLLGRAADLRPAANHAT